MKKAISIMLASVTGVLALSGCAAPAAAPAAEPAAEVAEAEAPAEAEAEAPAEAEAAEAAASEITDEPVTLTFWVNDGSTQWMECWGTVAEDYMALHPNVTIEVVGIPWDSSATKFNTAAATDTLPDLAHLAAQNLSPMMAMDKVVNLQPYLDEYENKDDLSSAHLAYFQNIDPSKEGLWMAPMFGSDKQMWYRKDWFEEAGIEFPKTWDEFFETVTAMTNDEHAGYSFRGGPGGWDLLFDFLYAYTDSETMFDENGKSLFNKPEALEGFKKFAAMYWNKEVPDTALANGYTEMIAEFAAGNAAMAWHHLQSETLITDKLDVEKLGYGWIPTNSAGRRIKKADAQGVVMFTACDEAKRDVAWDYIKFLWTPEEQKKIILIGGGVPTNIKTDVSDMPFVNEALKQAADPATTGISYPEYLPDWTSFATEDCQADFQAVLLQEMTPEEALEKWASTLDAMQAEWLADNQ